VGKRRRREDGGERLVQLGEVFFVVLRGEGWMPLMTAPVFWLH